jgi:hypothetical protein
MRAVNQLKNDSNQIGPGMTLADTANRNTRRLWRGLLFLCILSAGTAQAQDKPKAAFRSSSWEYGYLPQKCEVSHQYYLHNSGTAPLSVLKIRADCSCTGVSKLDHPIAPGDSAAIVVSFKSGRYRGLVKKSAEITTDDPDTPVLHVRFTSVVVKSDEPFGDIAIRPRQIAWKTRYDMIESKIDTIKITNNGQENLRLAVLHWPNRLADQSGIPDRLEPGKSAALLLHHPENEPLDNAQWGSITIAFVGKDTTLATIPIKIE